MVAVTISAAGVSCFILFKPKQTTLPKPATGLIMAASAESITLQKKCFKIAKKFLFTFLHIISDNVYNFLHCVTAILKDQAIKYIVPILTYRFANQCMYK